MHSDILCIYHANCLDGFGAAYLIWRAHPEAEFYAAHHGDQPPDVTGRDVIMVDFSYKEVEAMCKMAHDAKSLMIIDHHEGARPVLEALKEQWPHVEVLFDNDHSGVGGVWNKFYSYVDIEEYGPVLAAIEDRDLWRFKYPTTKAICAALNTFPMDFDIWGEIVGDPQHLVQMGETLLKQVEAEVAKLVTKAFPVTIAGTIVPGLNCPGGNISEVLAILAKDAPFAASFLVVGPNKVVFSLRSSPTGADVAAIARQYGGNGHVHAAGFRCSFQELSEILAATQTAVNL